MPVEHRTRALVLRTFDQGESDRVVHLYTAALGRVSAIAKGARRSKRRFPGTLEILSVADVRLVDPPRAQLDAAREREAGALLRGDPAAAGALRDRVSVPRAARPLDPRAPAAARAVPASRSACSTCSTRPSPTRCWRCSCSRRRWRGSATGRSSCAARCATPTCPRRRAGRASCRRTAARCVARCAAGRGRAGARAAAARARERAAPAAARARRARLSRRATSSCAARLVERFFRFHIGFELRSEPFLRHALADGEARAGSVDGALGPRGYCAPVRPRRTPLARPRNRGDHELGEAIR